MTRSHNQQPGTSNHSPTEPQDLGDRLQRVLIATDQCAFTQSYLRLALPEEREAVEQAGRVIFSQAFLAAGSAPRGSVPEELRSRFHEALLEITLLANQCGKERPAAEWFAQGQHEAGYFSFALARLEERLLEVVHTAPAASLPDPGLLALIAQQCPEEPAALLAYRALSALELALRLLDAARMRLRGAIQEGVAVEPEDGRFALSAILSVLVENQLRPALHALQALDGRKLASTKTAWAVGPWEALHSAAVELLEIDERLEIAVLSLSAEDQVTQAGAELSLVVPEVSEGLQATARRLFEARDQLEYQSLPSFSSRGRVQLRLASLGRAAESWHQELKSCLETLRSQPRRTSEAHETATWLEAELGGALGAALAELTQWASRRPEP